jgi:aldehyde dehydrogenase (NAD+)
VDRVAFTGSTATGIKIAQSAATHLARLSLELGGKSPNIIFPDADLDAAANGVIAGIFAASGQTCIAGSRLLVHKDIAAQLVDTVAARARTIRLGDPLLPETEMGPVAFKEQMDKVLGYVELARQEGADVVVGGQRATGPGLDDGYFVEPTIVRGLRNQDRTASEEIFGPVLSVIEFESEDEAVALANDSPYGLAAGIWTSNIRVAHRVAHRLRAGTVWINAYRVVSFNAPFGGYKMSGVGRENSLETVKEYTETKTVWVELTGATRDPFRLG